jgi:O-antigen/teichoic acid export membrane protein
MSCAVFEQMSARSYPARTVSLLHYVRRALVGNGPFARIARGAGWTLLSRALGGILGLAGQLVLARWLGAAGFGAYAVPLSVVAVLTFPATLGLDKATLRFLPEYMNAPGLYRGFIRFAGTITIIGSLAAGAVAVLLGFGLSSFGSTYGAGVKAAAGLGTLMPAIAMASAVARSHGRAFVAVAPGELLRPAIVLFAVGGLIWVGADGSAEKALVLITIGAAAALGIQFMVLRRDMGQIAPCRPEYMQRTWLGLALPMLAVAGLSLALAHGNIILVAALLEPSDAGAYVAAVKISALVAMVLTAANALAAPTYAQLHATGASHELATVVRHCAHLIFWPTLLVAGVTAIAGPWMLTLAGSEFASAYPALLVLIVGQLVNAGMGSVGYLTQLTGDQHGALFTLGVSAVVNLILSLALIPVFGIVGAALASATSMVLWNIWLHRRVVRRLGVYPAITDALR